MSGKIARSYPGDSVEDLLRKCLALPFQLSFLFFLFFFAKEWQNIELAPSTVSSKSLFLSLKPPFFGVSFSSV